MIRLFSVVMDPSAPEAVTKVLRSGWVAQGPRVDEFEANLTLLAGRPVVTVNSGTSALDLAYQLIGVKRDSFVVVSPLTCIATALPLFHRRAVILWADVDPKTGLIDAGDVARKVSGDNMVAVATDWGGHHVPLGPLRRACGDCPIVIDAAHRLADNEFDDGRTYTCFSTQAIKFLNTGDGGYLCPPAEQVDRAKRLRWFGFDRTSKEDFRSAQRVEEAGFKWHMNDVAAAIGLANLGIAQRAVERSQANAVFYTSALKPTGRLLGLPTHATAYSQFWLYTILVEDRDGFVAFAKRRGVEVSRVHTRIDRHPCFRLCGGSPYLPGVDHFDAHQVSIPVGLHVSDTDREIVANTVLDWAEGCAR